MKKTINIKILFPLLGICLLLLVAYFAYSNYFENISEVSNNNLETKEGDLNLNSEKVSESKLEDKIKIIAIGDSLTAGYNLPLGESYPKILEKKLQQKLKEVEIINAGVSGETTAGLLERIEFIKSQNPEIILITIGGNDAFRNLPIKNTKENIEKIIVSLKEKVNNDKIFLMQIKAPLNLGLNYSNEFNDMYKEIAKKQNVKVLEFVTEKVFLNKSLMLEDGIHPNAAGYEYIVDNYILENLI